MRASVQAEVLSRSSSSPLTEIYQTEEFKNEWANDVRFHVARHLLHLRRYRNMSQIAVGKAMGTSQSAIARIESAQENITLDTLERLTVALKGRFQVSIFPQEYKTPERRPWWDLIGARRNKPWTVVQMAGKRGAQLDEVLIHLERAHELKIANTLVAGSAGLLAPAETSER
jgi:transcriptional regulator with XRE-family HTH domain